MFNRTYNAQNVETARTFPCLPVGEYKVQIVSSQDKVSRNTGKDMIELQVEVIDGQYKGARLWSYIVDDQYADQKVYEIMTSCGKQIPQQITSTVFRGLIGTVKTKQRQFNGETKAEINYWLRPKAGEAAPASSPAAPASDKDHLPF